MHTHTAFTTGSNPESYANIKRMNQSEQVCISVACISETLAFGMICGWRSFYFILLFLVFCLRSILHLKLYTSCDFHAQFLYVVYLFSKNKQSSRNISIPILICFSGSGTYIYIYKAFGTHSTATKLIQVDYFDLRNQVNQSSQNCPKLGGWLIIQDLQCFCDNLDIHYVLCLHLQLMALVFIWDLFPFQSNGPIKFFIFHHCKFYVT